MNFSIASSANDKVSSLQRRSSTGLAVSVIPLLPLLETPQPFRLAIQPLDGPVIRYSIGLLKSRPRHWTRPRNNFDVRYDSCLPCLETRALETRARDCTATLLFNAR
ncbi:hypothetical protein [Achromobacter aloeverae]